MSYVVRYEGQVIGVKVLTVEEVREYNKHTEISLEKIVADK